MELSASLMNILRAQQNPSYSSADVENKIMKLKSHYAYHLFS